nr:hypothetical protein [Tanacetum cinerariifolium]
IDSLLDEFADELILFKSIPPRIDEADCDPEEEICLIEKLLYDNSSPHPLEESISKKSDAAIESFSQSPIPVKDNDSLMEEIDLSLTLDDSMPSGIEDDDYDSERDILEELLSNDSLSLHENESFHFDIPSSLRPPAKPPDVDEIEPNLGMLNCGNILIDGTCSKCNSGARNSFVYDPNPKSFNEVQSIFNLSPLPPIAITLDLPTVEPEDSLRMRDVHLDTISKTKSDEFINSSFENLVPRPSESEDERECDMPACDDFTTFSNLLFDAGDDFSSSDNESFSDKEILKEIYSNPLFNEEIISIKIYPHHFNA